MHEDLSQLSRYGVEQLHDKMPAVQGRVCTIKSHLGGIQKL